MEWSLKWSNQRTLRTLPSMNMIGHITLEKAATWKVVSSLVSWSILGNTVGMMQMKRPMTTAKLHSSLRRVGFLRRMINLWRDEEHSDIGQYVINWSPLFAIDNYQCKSLHFITTSRKGRAILSPNAARFNEWSASGHKMVGVHSVATTFRALEHLLLRASPHQDGAQCVKDLCFFMYLPCDHVTPPVFCSKFLDCGEQRKSSWE